LGIGWLSVGWLSVGWLGVCWKTGVRTKSGMDLIQGV